MYEVTVSDPTVWVRAVTYRIPMQMSDQPLFEYACHEGNYGLYNILAGARRARNPKSKAGSRLLFAFLRAGAAEHVQQAVVSFVARVFVHRSRRHAA